MPHQNVYHAKDSYFLEEMSNKTGLATVVIEMNKDMASYSEAWAKLQGPPRSSLFSERILKSNTFTREWEQAK